MSTIDDQRPVHEVQPARPTVTLSLLYIGFIRVLEPNLNTKVLVLGVYLIAVTAAVCLNASTLDAMAPPAGIRNGPSPTAAARKSAGDLRGSEPDNSRSNDE